MPTFPAITIWQPWATLIAAGAKPYEFRSWPAPHNLQGRRVAIHAGARAVRPAELRELLAKLATPNARVTGVRPDLAVPILERALRNPGELPRSSILCTARLGRPIRNEDLAQALGVSWINDSDRTGHSNWGWPLSDIQVLTPFAPATGRQGWWDWSAPDGEYGLGGQADG